MRKPSIAVLAIAAALLGSACSEEPKRPPVTTDGTGTPDLGGVGGGGGDGGGGDGGLGDGGDAGTGCTELAPTGGVINQNAVNDDPPAGTGGTIEDGVYDITDALVYVGAAGLPGPTGSSFQGSIRITGTTFERVIVFRSSAGASTETRSSGTLATTNSNATVTLACPTASQEQLTYSVATTSVTFSNLVTKESFTFTRQP